MARRKSKNPKARSAAAKKLLKMSLRNKMAKGSLQANDDAMKNGDKVPQRGLALDSGNPGEEMK
jgi:hypothetical protein